MNSEYFYRLMMQEVAAQLKLRPEGAVFKEEEVETKEFMMAMAKRANMTPDAMMDAMEAARKQDSIVH